MDLLFRHTQTKTNRIKKSISECEIKLFSDNGFMILDNEFNIGYVKFGVNRRVTFKHQLNINLDNGDFDVRYEIINGFATTDETFKTTKKSQKNDFKMLNDLIENGIYRGERRNNFWGVKYERAIVEVCVIITNIIKSKITNEYIHNKSYKLKPTINELYDLIVDFHLVKKGIKGHDNVYHDIMDIYPTKKHLKLNDHKFLPAVLDGLGIKSKFFIKVLSSSDKYINIHMVNFFCKLFGDKHLDYMKKIEWERLCQDSVIKKIPTRELKNDFEKNSFVKLINNWDEVSNIHDGMVNSITKLMKLRDDLEKNGINIKLLPKNGDEFNSLMDKLNNMKQYLKRGYRLRYSFSDDFLNEIESDIVIGEEVMKVKILSTEEDFINEGFHMKNCMSGQFNNGLLYIFISATIKKKSVNLQYRRGVLVQSYAKSNTLVPDHFKPFIEILNDKLKKHKETRGIKVKYDFITN